MRTKNKLWILLVLGLGVAFYFGDAGRSSVAFAPDAAQATFSESTQRVENRNSSVTTAAPSATDTLLAQAFQQRRSNLQMTGSLPVSRLLPDDNKGSRHQKFILQTATGQTVLVAHNIDLAPRIANLQVGDTVEFYGEYEWNEKGGVIHWTHHDPQNRHAHGWLRHRGQTYQ